MRRHRPRKDGSKRPHRKLTVETHFEDADLYADDYEESARHLDHDQDERDRLELLDWREDLISRSAHRRALRDRELKRGSLRREHFRDASPSEGNWDDLD